MQRRSSASSIQCELPPQRRAGHASSRLCGCHQKIMRPDNQQPAHESSVCKSRASTQISELYSLDLLLLYCTGQSRYPPTSQYRTIPLQLQLLLQQYEFLDLRCLQLLQSITTTLVQSMLTRVVSIEYCLLGSLGIVARDSSTLVLERTRCIYTPEYIILIILRVVDQQYDIL